MRTATLERETRETQIKVTVTLDGKGKAKGEDGRTWVKVRLGMGEPKADGSYASYRSLGWLPEEFVQA